jgi:hypothetical protein
VTARTSAGWSLLIRAPADWLQPRYLQVLEGVLDTERYGAKLSIIVRLGERDRQRHLQGPSAAHAQHAGHGRARGAAAVRGPASSATRRTTCAASQDRASVS